MNSTDERAKGPLKEQTSVVVVGAGPAGAAFALLLARAGVSVTLLERRTDFSREFRGEVLMPSGLSALAQLGLEQKAFALPGQRMKFAQISLNGKAVLDVDFAKLASPIPIQAVKQSELLELVVGEASRYPNFRFLRGAAVKQLERSASGRVVGVRYNLENQSRVLEARLVIGADGRNSVVRKRAELRNQSASPPMDIVWCKVPAASGNFEFEQGVRAYAGKGHLLVAYRTWGDQLQIGWVILKGNFGTLRERGSAAWIDKMAEHVADDLAAHLRAHRDACERPFLLDSVSDCVERWSIPGVLLLGDAAHTMSPVGGQGLNVALRDAIVAANHLVPLLLPVEQPSEETREGLDGLIKQALLAIEEERMREIAPVQTLQATPPRLILSRAWWGEPLRWLVSLAVRVPLVRAGAAKRLNVFLFGVTDVDITHAQAPASER